MEDEVELLEMPGPAGLRVLLDRAACIGAGDCVAAAPGAFALDTDSRVRFVNPSSVDARAIRRAAERCPTDAILLEDEHGQQVYP